LNQIARLFPSFRDFFFLLLEKHGMLIQIMDMKSLVCCFFSFHLVCLEMVIVSPFSEFVINNLEIWSSADANKRQKKSISKKTNKQTSHTISTASDRFYVFHFYYIESPYPCFFFSCLSPFFHFFCFFPIKCWFWTPLIF